MQANRTIHGESGMNVGNDGMSKMISLYCVHIIVTFFLVMIKDEPTEFMITPALWSSLSLIRVGLFRHLLAT